MEGGRRQACDEANGVRRSLQHVDDSYVRFIEMQLKYNKLEISKLHNLKISQIYRADTGTSR